MDQDVSAEIALTYPELYKELAKGRSLSLKTFFMWVLISIYQGKIICTRLQFWCIFIAFFIVIIIEEILKDNSAKFPGGVIVYGALLLFEDEFIHIVAISFSSLILTELIMVALNIRTWHKLMVIAELFSLALYALSLVILHDYFGNEIHKVIK